jgi:hypothetical protein
MESRSIRENADVNPMAFYANGGGKEPWAVS